MMELGVLEAADNFYKSTTGPSGGTKRKATSNDGHGKGDYKAKRPSEVVKRPPSTRIAAQEARDKIINSFGETNDDDD
mgnify:CR=1 FL=1